MNEEPKEIEEFLYEEGDILPEAEETTEAMDVYVSE